MIIMCVIERTKLENVADALWFNIFSLSEQMVSFPVFAAVVLTWPAKRLKQCRHMEPSG